MNLLSVVHFKSICLDVLRKKNRAKKKEEEDGLSFKINIKIFSKINIKKKLNKTLVIKLHKIFKIFLTCKKKIKSDIKSEKNLVNYFFLNYQLNYFILKKIISFILQSV